MHRVECTSQCCLEAARRCPNRTELVCAYPPLCCQRLCSKPFVCRTRARHAVAAPILFVSHPNTSMRTHRCDARTFAHARIMRTLSQTFSFACFRGCSCALPVLLSASCRSVLCLCAASLARFNTAGCALPSLAATLADDSSSTPHSAAPTAVATTVKMLYATGSCTGAHARPATHGAAAPRCRPVRRHTRQR